MRTGDPHPATRADGGGDGRRSGFKKPAGDRVATGTRSSSIETDKVSVNIESPGDGVLEIAFPASPDPIPAESVLGYVDDEAAARVTTGRRPSLRAIERMSRRGGVELTRALDRHRPQRPDPGRDRGVRHRRAAADLFDDRVLLPQMVVRWPDSPISDDAGDCDAAGAWLAPHGKTTMAPHILPSNSAPVRITVCHCPPGGRSAGLLRGPARPSGERGRTGGGHRAARGRAGTRRSVRAARHRGRSGRRVEAQAPARSIGLTRPVRLLLRASA